MAKKVRPIRWARLGPRIAELAATGLDAAGILAELGLAPSPANRAQVSKARRKFGCGHKQLAAASGAEGAGAAHPSAVWAGYVITSDWRDPACVARDMGGKRFENMPGMGASSSNPVFVPARKRAHSAGVADYMGAR